MFGWLVGSHNKAQEEKFAENKAKTEHEQGQRLGQALGYARRFKKGDRMGVAQRVFIKAALEPFYYDAKDLNDVELLEFCNKLADQMEKTYGRKLG